MARLSPTRSSRRRFLVLSSVLLFAGGARADDAFPAKSRPGEGVSDSFWSGGKEVRVRRFDPAGGGRRPAIVLLHGADGWAQMAGYRFAAAGLTAGGHVAVLVRYYDRTETPDGITNAQRTEFVRWLKGEAPGKAGDNARRHFGEWAAAVRDAVRYARGLPNVDPDRVAVVGFSLGGYLALAAAPACDPPVRAVVEMFGGLPEESRKTLGKLPPTLILHGEEDAVVPVAEAYKAAGFVAAQKQCVEIDIHKGVGHGFIRPETGSPDPAELLKGRTRMTEFLNRRLRPGDVPAAK